MHNTPKVDLVFPTKESEELRSEQKSIVKKTQTIIEKTHKINVNNETFRIKTMEEMWKTMREYLQKKKNLNHLLFCTISPLYVKQQKKPPKIMHLCLQKHEMQWNTTQNW